MKRAALIGLWVVATGLTTAFAYWVVEAAGSSVTDRPLTALVAADVTNPTSITSVSTTVPKDLTTATTASPATGGTSPTSTSSTTAAASTPTTAAAPAQRTTINSAGGSVIVSFRPGEVTLESVVPLPGFTYEIEHAGPDEVRVEFAGTGGRSEIRVSWEDGALKTEIDDSA